jgi:hypothetical protein
MKKLGIALCIVVVVFLLGCEAAKPVAPVAPPPAPHARYELHEVRNGMLTTTALLDNQTGRVWILAAVPGNGARVEAMSFQGISISQ